VRKGFELAGSGVLDGFVPNIESAGWGFEMGSFQRVAGEFSLLLSIVCGEEVGRKAVTGADGGWVGWAVAGRMMDRIRT
jgi:hypothetical protein